MVTWFYFEFNDVTAPHVLFSHSNLVLTWSGVIVLQTFCVWVVSVCNGDRCGHFHKAPARPAPPSGRLAIDRFGHSAYSRCPISEWLERRRSTSSHRLRCLLAFAAPLANPNMRRSSVPSASRKFPQTVRRRKAPRTPDRRWSPCFVHLHL